jgi:hypothetical protein
LRQRLKGPALASYYPLKLTTFRDFQKEFKPLELEVENEEELDRLEHIAACVAFVRRLLSHSSDRTQSEGPWEGSAEEEEDKRFVQNIDCNSICAVCADKKKVVNKKK